MVISVKKTKSMTTFKTPIRCKLVVDDKIIHEQRKFEYLRIDISIYGDVETEVRSQAARAMRAASLLNDEI